MRARLALFLALAVVVAGLLPSAVPAAPKAGGVLKLALLRDPTGWDPHINYGATMYSFQNNIYEGLVRYSLKGALEPALAVRWEPGALGNKSLGGFKYVYKEGS